MLPEDGGVHPGSGGDGNPGATQPGGTDPDTADALARQVGTSVDEIVSRWMRAQEAAVAKSNEILGRSNTETATHRVRYDFGINQFLRDTMPIRIVSWRER